MTLLLLFLFLLEAESQPIIISGPLTMAASTEKKILVVRIGATDVRRYDIAVGTKKHATPMGRFVVRHIVWNPAWVPPDARWAKGKQPAAPGDPKNPMRAVKIFFQEPDYYIHGTNDEDSIGSAASHGCIRMTEADAVALAKYLMEHAGAHHDDAWYENVQNSSKPTDVNLPRGIPMVIGR
ncbi:MAG TPA: L,D-transpeptidase [Thermoanaerobaculia bacterium]|jgi:lipoprotein-anchoring transpeptidase ErfK/SrfK